MQRLLLGVLFCLCVMAPAASAATLDVCGSGCTYSNSNLQDALSAATCGDTVRLQAGFVYNGNFTVTGRSCSASTFITVTSSRADWIPLAGTRVTPSHRANLATLNTTNTDPVLAGVLAAGQP